MGNRVKRVRTNVSEQSMKNAISQEWKLLFGAAPTNDQIAMVLAQNSLETANRKSMWNYNVGNITTKGTDSYNYFDDLTTSEQMKPGVWKKMNLKYRAYPTLNDGVKDYLKFISGNRYSKAWQHIINPNPSAFSKALKRAGYYTANEAPYTKAITRLFKQYSGKSSTTTVSEISNMQQPSNDGGSNTRQSANDNGYLSSLLNKYLRMVAASNKNLYKNYFEKNNVLIKINSNDYNNSVEFARILSGVLEEELDARAYTHTNSDNIEVECSIYGPKDICHKATEQLTYSVIDSFKDATKKIGGVSISAYVLPNKLSTYEPINPKKADLEYRKFILKFI